MKFNCLLTAISAAAIFAGCNQAQQQEAVQLGTPNPIIWADVPDMSMMRVGDTYYMSSTTMHMNPGVPIMKSKDLSNWEIVSYAYDILGEKDETMLLNGKNTYGKGSWASCIRYVGGKYFVSTFDQVTAKTYFSPPTISRVASGNVTSLSPRSTIIPWFLRTTARCI